MLISSIILLKTALDALPLLSKVNFLFSFSPVGSYWNSGTYFDILVAMLKILGA